MGMKARFTLLDLELGFQIFKHKASNIIKGLWYWVINKNELLRMNRVIHCNKCENKRALTCGNCGCFLQLKLRVKDEICPIGKW